MVLGREAVLLPLVHRTLSVLTCIGPQTPCWQVGGTSGAAATGTVATQRADLHGIAGSVLAGRARGSAAAAGTPDTQRVCEHWTAGLVLTGGAAGGSAAAAGPPATQCADLHWTAGWVLAGRGRGSAAAAGTPDTQPPDCVGLQAECWQVGREAVPLQLEHQPLSRCLALDCRVGAGRQGGRRCRCQWCTKHSAQVGHMTWGKIPGMRAWAALPPPAGCGLSGRGRVGRS